MGRPRIKVDQLAVVIGYALGYSVTQLARDIGVDRSVIRRVLADEGVELRDDRGAHWAQKREVSL